MICNSGRSYGSSNGGELESISVITSPDKTAYLVGETFDPYGMVVVAKFTNGTSAVVSDYTYAPKGSLSGSDTQITVSYTKSGTVVTTYVPISVLEYSTNLADNTPTQIQRVATAGFAKNLWNVGDQIPIALNGKVGALSLNGTYYAVILGFDHNADLEGKNTIHFQFGRTEDNLNVAFVDSKYSTAVSATGYFSMNSTSTNSGGWKDSQMKANICPAFLSALPLEWQDVIAECTKYTDNTGGGSSGAADITATRDKIWLLSEWEVFGTRTYSNVAEFRYQKQYEYYSNGNSTDKRRHDSTKTSSVWLLRSVTTYKNFCAASTGSGKTTCDGNRSYGFAPGFMVA